jgi:hypothetical protein
MGYLVSTNLNILNKDNEPTFVISNRKEVIDLTLGTDKIGDLVTNWHVSDDISFSDHRYIEFQVGDLEVTSLIYHNPKRNNWESYWEDLKANLGVVPRVIYSVQDVELAVDLLQQAILSSCHQNCPARVAVLPRTVPWWNKELSHLKVGFLIKLKGQVTGNHIRQPTPVTTKRLEKPNGPLGGTTFGGLRMYLTGLMRIMGSHSANRMESVKLPGGRFTQSGKTLRELYRIHFPGSAGEEVSLEGQGQPNLRAFAVHREDLELSKKVVD